MQPYYSLVCRIVVENQHIIPFLIVSSHFFQSLIKAVKVKNSLFSQSSPLRWSTHCAFAKYFKSPLQVNARRKSLESPSMHQGWSYQGARWSFYVLHAGFSIVFCLCESSFPFKSWDEYQMQIYFLSSESNSMVRSAPVGSLGEKYLQKTIKSISLFFLTNVSDHIFLGF